MQIEQFSRLIAAVTAFIGTKALTPQLEHELNSAFPASGAKFQEIFSACQQAIAAGWMCNRQAAGIKFGRVIKPGATTDGFSVDVVDMDDIAGPHHRHPNGEIDLVMPLSSGATFDGRGAGWRVYGPGSSHSPTVSSGRALVLYLLPEGSIEFTRPSASPPRIHVPRDYNAAVDLIERNLQAGRAQKAAYIDDAGSYTYEQLARRVDRFAAAIHQLGVQMEQRVLLCLLDTIDFPVAFLGCIKAGVVPIAINTLMSRDDVTFVLDDSRACAVIVSEPLLSGFSEPIARSKFLRHRIVSGAAVDGYLQFSALLEAAGDGDVPAAPTTCDDACFWLYSSGSTGAPKGTVHAHSSIIQTAELYARAVVGYQEQDVVFCASKLPFAYGLGNSLSFPLAVGATAVLMAERPTPAAIIERLKRHRPTIFCTIPTAYAALLASDDLPPREASRLRLCTSAGEALPSHVGERWSNHFGVPILDGIGSTEMLHIFISNTPTDVHYGTTGKLVPGYEGRIVDENGERVPVGEAGELLVRGPTRAILYWNNRARSATTFRGEWTHTGDKFRQTEAGCYIYEGRMDDMLKVSGLYVSPVEVESALMKHEAVLEAAVVGNQDAQGLTKVCGFVVLKPGCDASAQELQQHVKALLAPHKYPRSIQFMGELPKTVTGKIQRFKLRQQLS